MNSNKFAGILLFIALAGSCPAQQSATPQTSNPFREISGKTILIGVRPGVNVISIWWEAASFSSSCNNRSLHW